MMLLLIVWIGTNVLEDSSEIDGLEGLANEGLEGLGAEDVDDDDDFYDIVNENADMNADESADDIVNAYPS